MSVSMRARTAHEVREKMAAALSRCKATERMSGFARVDEAVVERPSVIGRAGEAEEEPGALLRESLLFVEQLKEVRADERSQLCSKLQSNILRLRKAPESEEEVLKMDAEIQRLRLELSQALENLEVTRQKKKKYKAEKQKLEKDLEFISLEVNKLMANELTIQELREREAADTLQLQQKAAVVEAAAVKVEALEKLVEDQKAEYDRAVRRMSGNIEQHLAEKEQLAKELEIIKSRNFEPQVDKAELEKSQQEALRLRQELELLRQQLRDSQSQAAAAQEASKAQSGDVSRLRAELQALQKELEDSRARLSELEGQNQADKKSESPSASAQVEDLQNEIKMMSSEITRRSNQITELKQINAESRAQLSQVQKKLSERDNSILQMKGSEHALKKQLDDSAAQLTGLKAQLEARNNEIKSLKQNSSTEANQLKSQSQGLREELDGLRPRVADLEAQLAKSKSDCSALEKEKLELEANVKAGHAQLAKEAESKKRAEEQAASSSAAHSKELADKEEKISQIQSEYEELKVRFAEAMDTLRDMEKLIKPPDEEPRDNGDDHRLSGDTELDLEHERNPDKLREHLRLTIEKAAELEEEKEQMVKIIEFFHAHAEPEVLEQFKVVFDGGNYDEQEPEPEEENQEEEPVEEPVNVQPVPQRASLAKSREVQESVSLPKNPPPKLRK